MQKVLRKAIITFQARIIFTMFPFSSLLEVLPASLLIFPQAEFSSFCPLGFLDHIELIVPKKTFGTQKFRFLESWKMWFSRVQMQKAQNNKVYISSCGTSFHLWNAFLARVHDVCVGNCFSPICGFVMCDILPSEFQSVCHRKGFIKINLKWLESNLFSLESHSARRQRSDDEQRQSETLDVNLSSTKAAGHFFPLR